MYFDFGMIRSLIYFMIGLGTIVNTAAVILGAAIGLILKKVIPQRLGDALVRGVALCVLYIGIDGALKCKNPLIMIISMVLGATVGTLLDLDGKVTRLGNTLEKKFSKNAGGSSTFGAAFVQSFLLFCVGAMTVTGAIQSGMTGDNTLLFSKSVLDFVSAIIYASTMGAGVFLSAPALLVYQGAITLAAMALGNVLTGAMIAEMTAVGSLLIIGISLNMLSITKLKLMDYIPAIFFPILLCLFM
jgi:uncharacterized membrane protein YqgA involved in biofilm formation